MVNVDHCWVLEVSVRASTSKRGCIMLEIIRLFSFLERLAFDKTWLWHCWVMWSFLTNGNRTLENTYCFYIEHTCACSCKSQMYAGLENTIYIWRLSYKLYFRRPQSLPVNKIIPEFSSLMKRRRWGKVQRQRRKKGFVFVLFCGLFKGKTTIWWIWSFAECTQWFLGRIYRQSQETDCMIELYGAKNEMMGWSLRK